MAKDKLTPSTDLKDPWNKNYNAFKAHHETNNHRTPNGRVPESSVFDIGEIINAKNTTGATKFAVYAMKHPHPNLTDKGLMVIVFFNDNLQRITSIPYLSAEHNCPDDCQTDPFDRPRDPKSYDDKPDSNE